jgi:hypothetical protein
MILLITFIGLWPSSASAEEGEPVAIRFWSGQAITLETMWNFQIGLRIAEANRQELDRASDLEIMNSDVQSKFDGIQTQMHVWQPGKNSAYVFDRIPNEKDATWLEEDKAGNATGNAVKVSLVSLESTESKEPLRLNQFEVDGVTIVDCDTATVSMLVDALEGNPEIAKNLTGADALLIGSDAFSSDQAEKLASLLTPRMVIIPESEIAAEKIGDLVFEKVEHNTVAIAKTRAQPESTRWIMLGNKPWGMNAELTDLFTKKEAASKSSRELFATLSVEQLNFEPSNGSHTPRWNTEHMMGRELLFFSQIYRAVDPMIQEMDLNPKQMPKDYEFKHPDWSGEEEAAQTQRVQAFTRRFAYLLDGVDLDKKAKGSRFWTPRALLLQMDRHYNEHTANVRKKMELPEWPAYKPSQEK